MIDVEEYMFKKPYEIMTLQDVYVELIIAELQEDRKKWVNQYTKVHNDYVSLQKQNEQLQNNWNELKKWLEEIDKTLCETMIRDNSEFHHFQRGEIMFLRNIKIKMQELEQGKDE